MKAKFKINGIDCEYDFLDADKMEVYENMLNDLYKKFEEEDKKPVTSSAAQMRTLCGYIKDGLSLMFDNVEELLPGNNYGECLEAIAIISKAQQDSHAGVNGSLRAMHAPQNRQHRRHPNRHK